jgi:hypothetical protein
MRAEKLDAGREGRGEGEELCSVVEEVRASWRIEVHLLSRPGRGSSGRETQLKGQSYVAMVNGLECRQFHAGRKRERQFREEIKRSRHYLDPTWSTRLDDARHCDMRLEFYVVVAFCSMKKIVEAGFNVYAFV